MYPSYMKTFLSYPYGYYSQNYLQINDQITTPQWIYISRPWQLLPVNFNQSNAYGMNETTYQQFNNNSFSSNNNHQHLSIQELNKKKQSGKNNMKYTKNQSKFNSYSNFHITSKEKHKDNLMKIKATLKKHMKVALFNAHSVGDKNKRILITEFIKDEDIDILFLRWYTSEI